MHTQTKTWERKINVAETAQIVRRKLLKRRCDSVHKPEGIVNCEKLVHSK